MVHSSCGTSAYNSSHYMNLKHFFLIIDSGSYSGWLIMKKQTVFLLTQCAVKHTTTRSQYIFNFDAMGHLHRCVGMTMSITRHHFMFPVAVFGNKCANHAGNLFVSPHVLYTPKVTADSLWWFQKNTRLTGTSLTCQSQKMGSCCLPFDSALKRVVGQRILSLVVAR